MVTGKQRHMLEVGPVRADSIRRCNDALCVAGGAASVIVLRYGIKILGAVAGRCMHEA